MRMRGEVLALLFLATSMGSGQNSSSVEVMRQTLDVSQRRSQLVMDGGSPFHMLASFEEFDENGKPAGKGKIEQLWEGPTRYRETFTVPAIEKVTSNGKETFRQVLSVPPRTLVLGDNGERAWRSGEWVVFEGMMLGFEALFKPFYLGMPIGKRLSPAVSPKGAEALECIGTEPDLQGVPETMPIALTTFCFSKGSHLLRLISRPRDEEITFNDVVPFEKKYIARSIEVGVRGKVRWRIHVDLLEAASDFSTLGAPPPPEAQLLQPNGPIDAPGSKLSLTSYEVMVGQLLTKVSPQYPQTGLRGGVSVKLHIDATGAVESAEVIEAQNQILKAPVLAAVRQWRYRISYRGITAVDTYLTLYFNYGKDDSN